ncbi:hypothetical protein WJX74_007094 [Apatococcus lobatus]|uniref:Uncharacterized protein n=1 Tax=Apatococcus lobatus TaxID=904363 RepID=A0AAW1QWA4_9CHLO
MISPTRRLGTKLQALRTPCSVGSGSWQRCCRRVVTVTTPTGNPSDAELPQSMLIAQVCRKVRDLVPKPHATGSSRERYPHRQGCCDRGALLSQSVFRL